MSRDVEQIEQHGLNPKQIQFCREYIVDLNATQAYIRAGYSKERAGANASRLMSNERIQALVARFARDRALRTQTEADQVISQAARIAMGDIRRIFTSAGGLRRVEDLDDDTAAAVQSVKVSKRPSGEYDDDGNPIYEDVVEYRMADKRGALDLLGKHMALWVGVDQGSDSTADALRDLAKRLPS